MLIGKSNTSYSLTPVKTMRIASNLITSLILTTIASFAIPITLAGLFFGSAFLVGLIPGLEIFGHEAISEILKFLAVFGSGKPFAGILILGLASSFVGVLFDLFNTYRFQSLRE